MVIDFGLLWPVMVGHLLLAIMTLVGIYLYYPIACGALGCRLTSVSCVAYSKMHGHRFTFLALVASWAVLIMSNNPAADSGSYPLADLILAARITSIVSVLAAGAYLWFFGYLKRRIETRELEEANLENDKVIRVGTRVCNAFGYTLYVFNFFVLLGVKYANHL